MSHFWTKEGLFGQKRRVLGQKCRVLGQKGGFLDKSRIFGQDKFTDGQASGILVLLTTLVWSIWNIKIWHRASNFDVGRQFDGFWRPTSIFDVLSQIFDVQHQFLTSYVKSGVNIWCPASIFDAEHQIFDVGRQIFDVGRQIFDVAHQIFDARRQILTRDVKYWCRTSKTIKLTSNIKIWCPKSIFDITDASYQYQY